MSSAIRLNLPILRNKSWALYDAPFSYQKLALGGLHWYVFAGEAGDLGPALHQSVVGQGLGRPFLSLADRVETIGQLAGDLGLGAEPRQKCRGGAFATGLQRADQLVPYLPSRKAPVDHRIPGRWQLARLEQPHLAALRDYDPCPLQARYRRHLGLTQNLCVPKTAGSE